MKIIIGKTSGFCGGVLNAVSKTEQELEKEKGKTIYCLGELVHNKQVVEKLEKQGLKVIEDIEEANRKTIIRAHGVPQEVYEKANHKGIEIIDLTCPKVLKIHNTGEEYAKNVYFIVLVGVEEHPETIGTISFCGENSCLIRNKEDIAETIGKILKSNIKKILILVQTTYSLQKFEEIVEELQQKLSAEYEICIQNTICSATKLRQEETEKISKQVDAMIIVGGKNSSNTKKLYDIAKINCKNSFLVETVKDLDVEDMKHFKIIGIMAGASTPNESVEEIKNTLMNT